MDAMNRAAALLVGLIACSPAQAAADQADENDDKPTIQDRFAVKESSVYGHLTGLTHIRNDFYSTFGFGIDAGYYPFESLGFEARWEILESNLTETALDLKDRTGLTPDAQPQRMMFLAGARWSFGYGKILILDNWVAHFDPQLTLHGGVALAETRTLPTFKLGPSLVVHFAWGIQAKLDLPMSIQVEGRDRGSVTSFGFAPMLGVGWSWNFGGER